MSLDTRRMNAFWFPIAFVLNGYATGIPGLSIGSLLLVIIICYSIISRVKSKKKMIPRDFMIVGFLFVYFCISVFDYMRLGGIFSGSAFMTYFKLIIWGISVTVLTQDQFDVEKLIKNFLLLAIISTYYIYIQSVMWYGFGVFLPNLFEFGPLRAAYEGYNYESYYSYVTALSMLRPASFYSEPSFYGNIMIVAIALILFGYADNCFVFKKKKFYLAFFVGGVIVSTSTGGIVLTIILFLIYYFEKLKKTRSVFIMYLAVPVIYIVYQYLMSLNLREQGLNNLSFALSKLGGLSESGRVGKSFNVIKHLDYLGKVFGLGIGNQNLLQDDVYLNSISDLIATGGFFTLGLFVFGFIKILIDVKLPFTRAILMLYIIKAFSSGILFSTYGILFVFFAFTIENYNLYIEPNNTKAIWSSNTGFKDGNK